MGLQQTAYIVLYPDVSVDYTAMNTTSGFCRCFLSTVCLASVNSCAKTT